MNYRLYRYSTVASSVIDEWNDRDYHSERVISQRLMVEVSDFLSDSTKNVTFELFRQKLR